MTTLLLIGVALGYVLSEDIDKGIDKLHDSVHSHVSVEERDTKVENKGKIPVDEWQEYIDRKSFGGRK